MLRSLNKTSSGRRILGTPKVGVLGSNIPSTGTSGPAYTYNDLNLPADADKYIRGVILSGPSAGDFFAYEDTSFTFANAPDGTYYATYQLYVDNTIVGSPATITLQVGEAAVTVNCVVGNSTAQGSDVSLNRTINAIVSNGVAQGLSSSVSNGNSVSTSIGEAISSGLAASVVQSQTVNALTANADAVGLNALIGTSVNCSVGEVFAAGLVSSITTNNTINTIVASCLAAGLTSTVVIGNSNIGKGDRVSVSFNTVTYSIRLR